MIVVDLAAAIICFAYSCYPALIGKDTPKGEYSLTHYTTSEPGYGGDILVFKETEHNIYAIHRVLDIDQRLARINSPYVEHRIITAGCVNVSLEIYDKLISCCTNSKINIK